MECENEKLLDSELKDLLHLFKSNENLTKSIDSCDYFMRKTSELENENARLREKNKALKARNILLEEKIVKLEAYLSEFMG